MGRECKFLLIEFFNSLEKIAQSLEVNGVPKIWLKTRTWSKLAIRLIARSTDHAHKCTRKKKSL